MTNGVAEETLKFELGRWKQLVDENTNVMPDLFLKDFSILQPEALRHWTEFAHGLTDGEVSHLGFLTFSPGNVGMALPLIVVNDRFLIVPSEKWNRASRIEQNGAANRSQPVNSDTNSTSPAAGSRR